MKYFASLWLFSVSTFAFMSPVAAQDSDESLADEIIMNAWSNPSDCNQRTAQSVAFSTLTSDFRLLLGKCVAVEGYWSGRALFGTAKNAKSERSNVIRRLHGNRVGLYAQWDLIGDPPDKPLRYRFVGRVGNCETMADALMVMGYCHYTGGPILLVSEAIRSEDR